jgi:hypothetical protein
MLSPLLQSVNAIRQIPVAPTHRPKFVGKTHPSRLSRTSASNQQHPPARTISDRIEEQGSGMGKEWIANLAQDIKQKGHEAAENYGRSQHQAEIVTTQGKPFFAAFAVSLEEDVNEIKRQLQGDVTSSDTIFQTISPTEVKLTRSRFPWFDARITHQDPIIVLDYAKGLGVAGDPTLDRKACHFAFHVDDDDALSIQESFGDKPRRFQQPEELARHIVELLFQL